MCHPKGYPKAMGIDVCGCSCSPTFRRFLSKKEQKEMLEEYRDQLKKEIAGLEECITECEQN